MTAKILRVIAVTFLLSAGCFTNMRAQDTIVKSVNSDYTMEVHRDSSGISVVVYLTDPTKYDSIAIEKGAWSDGQFRQISRIDLKGQNAGGGVIEVKDTYPLNLFYDSYYHLVLVAKGGTESTSPPLLLPGKPVPVRKIHLE